MIELAINTIRTLSIDAVPAGESGHPGTPMALAPLVYRYGIASCASTFGWERYVGRSGRIIGMKTFGTSAPLKQLQRKFGFEPDQVASAAKKLLGR